MPAFLHFYPGLTPDSYYNLKRTEFQVMKAYLDASTNPKQSPQTQQRDRNGLDPGNAALLRMHKPH